MNPHSLNSQYWANAAQYPRAIPLSLKPWLLDRGSLTERLIQHSGGDFQVQLVSQHWDYPRLDESRALDLRLRQRVLIREVLLRGRGEPWVYARSILPARALQHRLRFLKRLGVKPLGAMLFSDPFMQRSPIEVSALLGGELPLPSLQAAGLLLLPQDTIWGRRSVFLFRGQSLLVSEMFLPAFVKTLMN